MMPETLVLSTTAKDFAGDEVLIGRSTWPEAPVFVQISERIGGTGSAFLTLDESISLENQLHALNLDARRQRLLAGFTNTEVN